MYRPNTNRFTSLNILIGNINKNRLRNFANNTYHCIFLYKYFPQDENRIFPFRPDFTHGIYFKCDVSINIPKDVTI